MQSNKIANRIATINEEISAELAEYSRVVFQISVNGGKKQKFNISELSNLPLVSDVVVHKLAVITEDRATNVDFKHTFISTNRLDIINRLTTVAQKYEL